MEYLTLIQMSFTGGVMILVTAALRVFTIHRLPKRTFTALWEIILLRLLIPFTISSPISIYTLFSLDTSKPDPISQEISISHGTTIPTTVHIAPATPSVSHNVIITSEAKQVLPEGNVPIWIIIWLVGAGLLLLWFAMAYFRTVRKYRYAIRIKEGYPVQWLAKQKIKRKVHLCLFKGITSPLTYGIICLVILLPSDISMRNTEQLELILNHEMTHIKRFDTLKKAMAAIVLSIHWFNPMVWLMYLLFNRDIELACDEAVVRATGGLRAQYARAIIGMEEKKSSLAALDSHFSKNAVEERIVAIMKMKKTSVIASIAAVAVVIGVTGIFATSAQNLNEPPLSEPTVLETSVSESTTSKIPEPAITTTDVIYETTTIEEQYTPPDENAEVTTSIIKGEIPSEEEYQRREQEIREELQQDPNYIPTSVIEEEPVVISGTILFHEVGYVIEKGGSLKYNFNLKDIPNLSEGAKVSYLIYCYDSDLQYHVSLTNATTDTIIVCGERYTGSHKFSMELDSLTDEWEFMIVNANVSPITFDVTIFMEDNATAVDNTNNIRYDAETEAIQQFLTGVCPPTDNTLEGFDYINTGHGYIGSICTHIPSNVGDNVYAVQNGTVESAEQTYNYGCFVKIDHGNGISTVYCHLSENTVQEGDIVKAGDIIGKSGTSGMAETPCTGYQFIMTEE